MKYQCTMCGSVEEAMPGEQPSCCGKPCKPMDAPKKKK